MAKNKEVVRCVRQQTIATYDVNDGFLVDVVCDVKELMYSYWLYHKDCGVKVLYVQVPKIYKNDDGYTITNIAKPRMLRITLTQRLGKRIKSIIRIITFWYNKGEGLRLEKAWVFFCVRKAAENK